ncbi:ABC transporter ATP-binding protein [Paenibacillus sp. ACRRX]|uniref:ABC transporter ATP-binding protein n=1 Tax=Paenibacillus sp. ACRRX TaxID=2918206 RepID=UPI001EF51961|nr:ABC transporter ATP-binding protein [Paenibacillus sp. ACRRX]MCG7407941.1 ABC transporter ATP-binding protein [Paenibacillus sp. ACRRX]
MEVIKVNNLDKSFKIYHDKPTTLKEKVLFIKKKTYKELHILKNINLSVQKGEMIALIGHNGSGKSTLLKLLTKIIRPDSGQISITGRVSSLLELGAGFHPDFTGKENIYMNASIFGLTKKEIEAKMQEIISFSELGEFMYNPVRTYSSGMYMRLAFAIAINIEPDILLVDEVLAVGDASFQRKCLNRIKQLKSNGKTIVLVTHDHGVVERMCDRAVWIQSGEIRMDGRPKDVVNEYLMFLAEKDQAIEEQLDLTHKENSEIKELTNDQVTSTRWGNRDIEITSVKTIIEGSSNHIYSDQPMAITIDYTINNPKVSNPVFGIAFNTIDKIRVYGTNTQLESIDTTNISRKGTIKVTFPTINLIEGDYEIDVAVHDDTGTMFDFLSSVSKIMVLSKIHDVGYCRIPHSWEILKEGEIVNEKVL